MWNSAAEEEANKQVRLHVAPLHHPAHALVVPEHRQRLGAEAVHLRGGVALAGLREEDHGRLRGRVADAGLGIALAGHSPQLALADDAGEVAVPVDDGRVVARGGVQLDGGGGRRLVGVQGSVLPAAQLTDGRVRTRAVAGLCGVWVGIHRWSRWLPGATSRMRVRCDGHTRHRPASRARQPPVDDRVSVRRATARANRAADFGLPLTPRSTFRMRASAPFLLACATLAGPSALAQLLHLERHVLGEAVPTSNWDGAASLPDGRALLYGATVDSSGRYRAAAQAVHADGSAAWTAFLPTPGRTPYGAIVDVLRLGRSVRLLVVDSRDTLTRFGAIPIDSAGRLGQGRPYALPRTLNHTQTQFALGLGDTLYAIESVHASGSSGTYEQRLVQSVPGANAAGAAIQLPQSAARPEFARDRSGRLLLRLDDRFHVVADILRRGLRPLDPTAYPAGVPVYSAGARLPTHVLARASADQYALHRLGDSVAHASFPIPHSALAEALADAEALALGPDSLHVFGGFTPRVHRALLGAAVSLSDGTTRTAWWTGSETEYPPYPLEFAVTYLADEPTRLHLDLASDYYQFRFRLLTSAMRVRADRPYYLGTPVFYQDVALVGSSFTQLSRLATPHRTDSLYEQRLTVTDVRSSDTLASYVLSPSQRVEPVPASYNGRLFAEAAGVGEQYGRFDGRVLDSAYFVYRAFDAVGAQLSEFPVAGQTSLQTRAYALPGGGYATGTRYSEAGWREGLGLRQYDEDGQVVVDQDLPSRFGASWLVPVYAVADTVYSLEAAPADAASGTRGLRLVYGAARGGWDTVIAHVDTLTDVSPDGFAVRVGPARRFLADSLDVPVIFASAGGHRAVRYRFGADWVAPPRRVVEFDLAGRRVAHVALLDRERALGLGTPSYPPSDHVLLLDPRSERPVSELQFGESYPRLETLHSVSRDTGAASFIVGGTSFERGQWGFPIAYTFSLEPLPPYTPPPAEPELRPERPEELVVLGNPARGTIAVRLPPDADDAPVSLVGPSGQRLPFGKTTEAGVLTLRPAAGTARGVFQVRVGNRSATVLYLGDE